MGIHSVGGVIGCKHKVSGHTCTSVALTAVQRLPVARKRCEDLDPFGQTNKDEEKSVAFTGRLFAALLSAFAFDCQLRPPKKFNEANKAWSHGSEALKFRAQCR